jgi:hypothetical protein
LVDRLPDPWPVLGHYTFIPSIQRDLRSYLLSYPLFTNSCRSHLDRVDLSALLVGPKADIPPDLPVRANHGLSVQSVHPSHLNLDTQLAHHLCPDPDGQSPLDVELDMPPLPRLLQQLGCLPDWYSQKSNRSRPHSLPDSSRSETDFEFESETETEAQPHFDLERSQCPDRTRL